MADNDDQAGRQAPQAKTGNWELKKKNWELPPKRKSTAGRCIASTHLTQPGVPRPGSWPGPWTTTTTTGHPELGTGN